MANPEHVGILRQGVEQWNRWRKEHPGVTPNLDGADFRKMVVDGEPLWLADLREAKFEGVDASKMKHLFDSAKVKHGADLSGADLSGALLLGTNLYNADLKGAKLGALLAEANLRRANLSGADLT